MLNDYRVFVVDYPKLVDEVVCITRDAEPMHIGRLQRDVMYLF